MGYRGDALSNSPHPSPAVKFSVLTILLIDTSLSGIKSFHIVCKAYRSGNPSQVRPENGPKLVSPPEMVSRWLSDHCGRPDHRERGEVYQPSNFPEIEEREREITARFTERWRTFLERSG